jgi:hypothetical protein
MPLFCKQCNERRLPIFQRTENITLWLCEKCNNYVDPKDIIIRERTKSEKDEADAKIDNFKKTVVLTGEKMKRRKGVN